VGQLIQELNSPTKQQSRRVRAFKNGSIHEAALGRSGLMIRGDDDLLRSLQDDKTKLESKVKTAESRVRRLEDLLHRQSQATRPGSLFQPPSNSTRERNDSGSSIKSYIADDRRRSSDGGDPLLRKITQLENELREEKQRSAQIQKELADRTTQHDDIKDQMQEVNSTKRDLMENMEALKKEFVDERKSFEDEIKLLKARLEDTEEEIENFGESRENEKANYDQRVQLLEAELEHHSKERQDAMLKAQGQVDFLRNETRIQREQNEELDRDLQTTREEARNASKRLQELELAAESYLDALKELHSQLASDIPVPDDPVDLADSVQTLVADLMAKVKNMETDVSLLRTNVDQTSRSAEELRAELAAAQEKLAEEEVTSLHLREHVATETAKVKALEQELIQSRDEMSQLRSQLSDGETGSETLQKKLADEETKLADLTEQLAARQSQVGGLEEELHMYKERQEVAQTKLNNIMKHYESRDERSRDLTERLYSQNDRMRHLLERIGYSMTREEGQITINKIPRPEKSAHNPNDSSDPGTSLRKSITLGSRTLQDSADLDLLKWTNPSDAAAEAEKYQAFLDKLGDFDIDLFSDTVYHRIREMDYKARKWQREARNYRDRAHALQKESHDKIAYRHFKDGDLALFLPTRNQQAGAWAAFNVGFPHYFLREQDAHRLRHREWLVARINRIQERVVDLSKSLQSSNEADPINDEENDNPFQLSDGLRWYLIDALEDKPGAPATPGMGKSTVAANNVEATASIHAHAIMSKGKGKKRESVNSIEGINKSLSKSLESRRSSSTSKKALPFAGSGGAALLKSSAIASETNSLRAVAPETPAGTSPTQGGGMATIGASGQGDTADNEDAGKAPEVRTVDSLMGP
jgi:autophagy-related protein 11